MTSSPESMGCPGVDILKISLDETKPGEGVWTCEQATYMEGKAKKLKLGVLFGQLSVQGNRHQLIDGLHECRQQIEPMV